MHTAERKGIRSGGRYLQTILCTNEIRILLVSLRANPHLLECRQSGEDTTSDPSTVPAFWRSVDFDLLVFDSELLHLVETVTKPYMAR